MASNEGLRKIIYTLVDEVRSNIRESRVKALKALSNLSAADENKVSMSSPDLGLLPALVAVVSSDSSDARVHALKTLMNLSIADGNKVSMGSPDLGLVSALVVVVSSDCGEARVHALGTIHNLSAAAENRVSMGSVDLGLVPALVAAVSSDSSEARVYALGSLWWLSLRIETVDYFVSCNGMPAVLAALQSSPRESDSFRVSLTVLMVSSREITAARALSAAGGVGIITALIDSGGLVGIKAAIILSFLLGRDESSGAQLSLLESKPELGDLLESILSNTVNGLDGDRYGLDGDDEYGFGLFELNVIVAAIASMAVSDKNKTILLQKPTILRCLFQVLSLFIDDAPHIPYRGTAAGGFVGGGGQDIESAESAIEALQLLSFAYESDSDLRQQYNVIEMDTVSLLKQLSTHSKLSDDAKRSAQHLSRRLQKEADQPPTAEEDISTPSSIVVNNKRKHLMLSYAWGCRKELVISLQEQLTALGVEVWRDETGSSLLTKMQGATDDVMAQAIELSHTVVVCVSPHYKASGNCRQEGKYTNSMYKKGKLNVVFVMMDGDYYNSVDGWLGIMLGDSLWHPLWDAKHVSKTAADIAATVTAASSNSGATPLHTTTVPPQTSPPVKDDNLRSPVGSPDAAVVPPPTQPIITTTSTPYDEAWAVLSDPSKANDPERLSTFLSEIGLSKACELVDCDNELWNELAEYLKRIPKRTLLRILAEKSSPEK